MIHWTLQPSFLGHFPSLICTALPCDVWRHFSIHLWLDLNLTFMHFNISRLFYKVPKRSLRTLCCSLLGQRHEDNLYQQTEQAHQKQRFCPESRVFGSVREENVRETSQYAEKCVSPTACYIGILSEHDQLWTETTEQLHRTSLEVFPTHSC